MRLTTDFDKLSFHDAGFEEIEREAGEVRITFTGAYIPKDHPQSGGRAIVIERGVLRLLGVSGEKTIFWGGDRETKPHPNPSFPLDEVMQAKFDGSTFSFDGFLDREPWFEWFVQGSAFEIEVFGSHEASR